MLQKTFLALLIGALFCSAFSNYVEQAKPALTLNKKASRITNKDLLRHVSARYGKHHHHYNLRSRKRVKCLFCKWKNLSRNEKVLFQKLLRSVPKLAKNPPKARKKIVKQIINRSNRKFPVRGRHNRRALYLFYKYVHLNPKEKSLFIACCHGSGRLGRCRKHSRSGFAPSFSSGLGRHHVGH